MENVMAEINVKKKNNSPNWPWILLVLLAVGVVGWLLIDNGDNNQDMAYIQESEEIRDDFTTEQDNVEFNNGQTGTDLRDQEFDQNNMEPTQNNAQANSFVSYVQENNENIGREPEYSSRALTELANALATLSEGTNLENDSDLQNLRQQADQLQNNPSEESSNIMSDAFTSAANVIEKVQNEQYPDLEEEANQVTEAAQAIQSDMSTDQEEKIKSFFNESANTIDAMSR